MFKRLYQGTLLFYALLSTTLFVLDKTDAFTLYKISMPLKNSQQWKEYPIPENLYTILNQEYTYLGRGAQAFAFASADGKHVLKFPNHARIQCYPFFPIFKQVKAHKYDASFKSYQIAYEQLKEETGTLFVHLKAKKNRFEKNVVLIDKLGTRHSIDLGTTPFILQKRAQKFYPTLIKLADHGRLQEVTAHVDSFLGLLPAMIRPGIANCDLRIEENFGFVNGCACKIDVGSFKYSDNSDTYNRKKILSEVEKLRNWAYEQRIFTLGAHINRQLQKLQEETL